MFLVYIFDFILVYINVFTKLYKFSVVNKTAINGQ